MENNVPLFFVKIGDDGAQYIDLEGLEQLSQYEPYFVIPKAAEPKVVEKETGDYDIVYNKDYPITIEWRKKKEVMTLDEAIAHCEKKAQELREAPLKRRMDLVEMADCEQCAEEHEQLAKWLKELKGYRNEKDI